MALGDDIGRIVYFGDSLSDHGAVWDLTSQLLFLPLPPEAYGYQQKFTNGETYSGLVPGLLGIGDVDYYAIGGARALGVRTLGDFTAAGAGASLLRPGADPALLALDVNLGGQLQRFLAAEALNPDDTPTAASILIGLNDLNNFTPMNPATTEAEAMALAAALVQTTLGTAGALATVGGVDEIILHTLPGASFFPGSQFQDPVLVSLGDTLIAGINDALKLGAGALSLAGISTTVVDFAAMAAEVAADTTSFGFVAPIGQQKLFGTGADPAIVDTPAGPVPFFPENPAVAALDPDQIPFWDLLHPSAALHGVLAAFEAASLTDGVKFLGDGNDSRLGACWDTVFAGAGNDRLVLLKGEAAVFGGLGDDFIFAGRDDDIAAGGSGDDRIGGGKGADVVAGNLGDDILLAGAGDDVVIDGLGSDRAFGGGGDDAFLHVDAALIGGATGADHDVFFGGSGHDTAYLVVGDDNRAAVEAELAAGRHVHHSATLGLTLVGVEDVVFLDDRAGFGDLELAARLGEADLWGLI